MPAVRLVMHAGRSTVYINDSKALTGSSTVPAVQPGMHAGRSTAHTYDDKALTESSKVPAVQPVMHAGRSTAQTNDDGALALGAHCHTAHKRLQHARRQGHHLHQ